MLGVQFCVPLIQSAGLRAKKITPCQRNEETEDQLNTNYIVVTKKTVTTQRKVKLKLQV